MRAYPSAAIRSRPVRTNPLSSRSTSAGSQSLRGRVPINTNSASSFLHLADPSSSEASATRSTWPSPSTRSISVRDAKPDVRRLLDLIDQVLRHGVAQAIAAHHDLHFFRVARQIHGALARRVPAADDQHALAAEGRCFGRSRRRSTRPRPCAPPCPARDARDRTCRWWPAWLA